MLLRVPGLGVRTVDRIIAARRMGALSLADIARLAGSIGKARAFIVTSDWRPRALLDDNSLRHKLTPTAKQLELFG